MSSPAGGEVRVGIGARLRTARERSGLTLLQAAEKMHVDSKVLEALESEQFESLGPPVFARGHLRRYAELVGEQPAQLQVMYAESARIAPPPDLTHVPKVPRASDSRKLVAPGIVGLIAIAIAGGVWIVLQLSRNGPEQAVATREEPIEAPAETPSAAGEPLASEAATPQSSRARNAAPGSKAPTDASPNAGAGSKPPAARAGAAANAAGPGAAEPGTPPATTRSVAVKLKFAADSWVEVYDVNGERLFYDIGSADSERSVTGTPPLRVVLGNAAGVSLEVNGRARAVPDNLVQDEAAHFSINRSGRIVK